MLDLYLCNSARSSQRLNPAGCTPAQYCNKPSGTESGLLCTCATVEQALKDRVMRDVHLER